MWKQIGLTALVVTILAGSAAAVLMDNNQGNDGSLNLNQRDGSGNPDSGGGNGNRGGQGQSESGQERGGGNRGQQQGLEGAGEPVAQEDWISLEGVVTAYDGNIVTIETDDDELVDLKLGPPRFLESLDVTFEAGDELEVLGFYEGDVFNVAEISLVDSGEQIVLRDADGNPLWNGGGRQGQGGKGRSGGSQDNGNQDNS